MTFYQAIRPFFFLMLPICLNATVYLERPEDFQPKAEIRRRCLHRNGLSLVGKLLKRNNQLFLNGEKLKNNFFPGIMILINDAYRLTISMNAWR